MELTLSMGTTPFTELPSSLTMSVLAAHGTISLPVWATTRSISLGVRHLEFIQPHHVLCSDPALIEKIGVVTALEVRATGIPYVFAPCIAVCRDPRWGRCYESYSEDPDVVSSMTSIIDGLQGKKPHGWDGPYVQKR